MIAQGSWPGPGDAYPRLLWRPGSGWWRPLAGLGLFVVCVFSGALAAILAATLVSTATGGPADQDEALAPDTVLGLLANNLAIAMLIPGAVLAVLLAHRGRAGCLASVTGRVRWGLLGRCLGLAALATLGSFALGFLLPTSTTQDVAVPPVGTLVGLLAVILLTTPLQAAAEEVGFRGYLTQAVASCFARPGVGIAVAAVGTAVAFALAHGVQDIWLFSDRLAFGAVASWLAWRTGGLEAPVALHVVNNLVSLVYGASTGLLSDALSATTLEWQFAVLDVAMMLTFAALVARLARRGGLVTRRTLSGGDAVGYPDRRPLTPPPAGREIPWGMG